MSDKIKSYDENKYVYSGTDEEYEEFLESIDGKFDEGKPVEDADLGDTKKINLQGVIDKFRKTAGDIKDASIKITSGARSKLDEMKVNRENAKAMAVTDEGTADNVIPETKKNAKTKSEDEILKNSAKLDALIEEADKLNEILKRVERSCDEAVKNGTAIETDVDEILRSVSSISKLNDSIFDLKNAQLNSKNSLENLEKNFTGLKKKCIWGVVIISILTLISIAMEVIILLS